MTIASITATELAARRQREPELAILDVREPFELDIAQIDGAIHIPMGEIPERISELDSDSDLVVVCHHGIRSAQICHYLAGQGFGHVINLSGGIDAWSVAVDPDVARY